MIEEFSKKWIEGYDVVYGSRVNRQASSVMNFAYKFFYRLFNKISYLEIPLDAGDFSLMDRRVVDEINKTTETDRFIRGLRAWVGFKQIGIPYARPERKFGTSTNKTVLLIHWLVPEVDHYRPRFTYHTMPIARWNHKHSSLCNDIFVHI